MSNNSFYSYLLRKYPNSKKIIDRFNISKDILKLAYKNDSILFENQTKFREIEETIPNFYKRSMVY